MKKNLFAQAGMAIFASKPSVSASGYLPDGIVASKGRFRIGVELIQKYSLATVNSIDFTLPVKDEEGNLLIMAVIVPNTSKPQGSLCGSRLVKACEKAIANQTYLEVVHEELFDYLRTHFTQGKDFNITFGESEGVLEERFPTLYNLCEEAPKVRTSLELVNITLVSHQVSKAFEPKLDAAYNPYAPFQIGKPLGRAEEMAAHAEQEAVEEVIEETVEVIVEEETEEVSSDPFAAEPVEEVEWEAVVEDATILGIAEPAKEEIEEAAAQAEATSDDDGWD